MLKLSEIVVNEGCLCYEVENLLGEEPITIPLCISEQVEVARALRQADQMRQYMEGIGGRLHADTE